jgi:hypothetical protein
MGYVCPCIANPIYLTQQMAKKLNPTIEKEKKIIIQS